MAEDCRCIMKSEIDHIKLDIQDIRATAKEQSKDMLSMRDSHTETKIYIRQIQDSQALMSKETKDNQTEMMKALRGIKEEPVKNQKQVKMAAWIFGVTYVIGTVLGLMKTFAPQLLQ